MRSRMLLIKNLKILNRKNKQAIKNNQQKNRKVNKNKKKRKKVA